MNKYNYTQEDYEFMNSFSAAILEQSPKKFRLFLWFWIVTVIALISWAYFAQIDEIVRGEGTVVPRSENKMVQNLEGGIVEKLLVKEGDVVKKGQILLKIDNGKSQSDYEATNLKSLELTAKIVRLEAEVNNKEFNAEEFSSNAISQYIMNEKKLYIINKNNIESEILVLEEQLKQKKNDLSSARSSIGYLRNEYNLISEEVRIAKPLVARKIRSKVDFLKLKREANNIRKELANVRISIPKTQSLINEVKKKMVEIRDKFRKVSQEELNKTVAELERVNANVNNLKDKVVRTDVYSPTNGIVQQIFFNTIGGVIKPGENLVEIVPTGETLLIETKIKPADIAFIYFKQNAKVKFTAYDYSIYGGLEGSVIKISADTEMDENKDSFYTVHIQTNENHLTKGDRELSIIPGMVVNVDILTGKKTILDYILKPILKAKQYTFTER
ncbi:HlyD family type I secretion periplasmic adaptor subunit [Poseidonibacter lekithochrous]|uniref:HlyD family type I secretion periplasmic adaptor subunit n=1 Tax=Poseidonibacter lekithochrous TaxID=1904463 RepID=UPI0008FC5F48|nr:HlyD family type I secretion periplasmic adaptor subunit [Poseidonibacter lekithochrous]QKJ23038.1 type I secretion system membrane fusion protein, HlyD family [Poseidonibacter lekithochrous]